MKISITGGKGGTGKSMIATSLAIEFAKHKITSLIDVDVECPNDHLLLSVKKKQYSKIYQLIPKWDLSKCTKCGKCASVCKQNAIVFVKDRYPAFVKDICIGCQACIITCSNNAISKTKKEIGTIYTGNNHGVNLITGELKLGELASGEVVAEVRKYSKKINKKLKTEITLIDSAAGIGCPVIASLVGTDYIVAVTEPTPSALHDLKRVLYLANYFQIKHGIIINKCDLEGKFCSKTEAFAKRNNIKIIGKIPYHQDFVKSTIKMKPVVEINSKYNKIFKEIANEISNEFQHRHNSLTS